MLAAIRAGDAVMVKGSLGSKMGPIVKALERRFPGTAALERGRGDRADCRNVAYMADRKALQCSIG